MVTTPATQPIKTTFPSLLAFNPPRTTPAAISKRDAADLDKNDSVDRDLNKRGDSPPHIRRHQAHTQPNITATSILKHPPLFPSTTSNTGGAVVGSIVNALVKPTPSIPSTPRYAGTPATLKRLKTPAGVAPPVRPLEVPNEKGKEVLRDILKDFTGDESDPKLSLEKLNSNDLSNSSSNPYRGASRSGMRTPRSRMVSRGVARSTPLDSSMSRPTTSSTTSPYRSTFIQKQNSPKSRQGSYTNLLKTSKSNLIEAVANAKTRPSKVRFQAPMAKQDDSRVKLPQAGGIGGSQSRPNTSGREVPKLSGMANVGLAKTGSGTTAEPAKLPDLTAKPKTPAIAISKGVSMPGNAGVGPNGTGRESQAAAGDHHHGHEGHQSHADSGHATHSSHLDQAPATRLMTAPASSKEGSHPSSEHFQSDLGKHVRQSTSERPPWNPNTKTMHSIDSSTLASKIDTLEVEPDLPLHLLQHEHPIGDHHYPEGTRSRCSTTIPILKRLDHDVSRPYTTSGSYSHSEQTTMKPPSTSTNNGKTVSAPSTPQVRRRLIQPTHPHHAGKYPDTGIPKHREQAEPPTPPELAYQTRPMSPHKPYHLAEHIRANALRMQSIEVKDNFNARMRALFLPSLFQSNEDISGRGRKVYIEEPAPEIEENPDDGFVVKIQIGHARSAAMRARRATGNVAENPMAIPSFQQTVIGGTNEDVNVGKEIMASSSSSRKGPSSSRKRRGGVQGLVALLGNSKSKANAGTLIKYPIATIDKNAFDMNPPDLSRTSLLWRVGLYWACRVHRLYVEVLEDRADAVVGEFERSGNVLHIPSEEAMRRRQSSVVAASRRSVTGRSMSIIAASNANLEKEDGHRDSEIRRDFVYQGTAAPPSPEPATNEDAGDWEEMSEDERKNVISAMRIKRLLEIPNNSREEADFDDMDVILGRFKIFSKLPPAHRYKLYNACKLESYPRGKILIREGNQAKQMYIILLGECLLQVRPGHPTAAVNMRLGIGGAAGEFTSYALNEVRNMRAICTMWTEVLVIDKLDYVTILREARTVDNFVAEYFATVPSLLSADKQLPVFLSQRSIIRRYETESLLIRAGEVCPNNYFIIRGKCRALHMVTFIKQDLGIPANHDSSMGSHAKHKYALVPYSNSGTGSVQNQPKLGHQDELVRELATVVELGPGQMFPPLSMSKVTKEMMYLQQAEKRRRASTMDHGRMSISEPAGAGSENAPPSPFHFVVVEKLECVVISHQDLVELLPREIFQKLCDSAMGITEVSSQEVEERYLSSQGWRGSRELDSSVIKDLVDPDSFKDESWSNPVVKRRNHSVDDTT
ncbi:hypothetical protein HDU97_006932 [Phlyctochytrium planicorne]|nr:hypothetical protein HDU97_006932 [Phlyctochytrium planicorne]